MSRRQQNRIGSASAPPIDRTPYSIFPHPIPLVLDLDGTLIAGDLLTSFLSIPAPQSADRDRLRDLALMLERHVEARQVALRNASARIG